MSDAPRILFTAFEPSGDALAAPVIAQLRRTHPHLAIDALGGPKMRDAGAQLLESSTDRPVMFGGALSQAWAHRQRLKRLKTWLAEHPIRLLVPVDSPAANWSICSLVRQTQPEATIAHLVMPQLWAWASWRIGKLRRLTDHVLCLLPFEPRWLEERGVAGSFVGHPVFERPRDDDDPHRDDNELRLALLPGSRRSEISHNWPMMLDIFTRLSQTHPNLRATVAAVHESAEAQVRALTQARCGHWPQRLALQTADTDRVLAWSDLVLVVSGTATLQVASHFKPMVVLFNTGYWGWQLVGRWVIRTRTFALPNLLACPPITSHDSPPAELAVPEFVPHFGRIEPVYQAVDALVRDPRQRQAQVDRLRALAGQFEGRHFASDATDRLIVLAQLTPTPA